MGDPSDTNMTLVPSARATRSQGDASTIVRGPTDSTFRRSMGEG